MKVYIVISTYGYDGGDEIEKVHTSRTSAIATLVRLAMERGWATEIADDKIKAVGSGLGYGIAIQEWEASL